MQRDADGWFECVDAHSGAGTRYWYEVDKRQRVPDPAARFMPDGSHGASEVVDPSHFDWPENGTACIRPQRELVFYELHIGTFTPEGTYAAAATHLRDLAELGVTAIELMPVAQAAGLRNWGYDGVGFYAPARAYGRPDELKAFIAQAHVLGLCVVLDVVYNHFGPEGNYLHWYAPEFFDQRRQTPWGAAIDYTAPRNRAVRDYVIENACYWLCEYRFDGLRLDAIETIADDAATPLVREISKRARAAAGRPIVVITENDCNDAELLRGDSPPCDAQWNDDVHHCLHVAIAGESDGYYRDYAQAPMALLGRALASGFSYQGEPSAFRDGKARGMESTGVPLVRFVNFLQNHDQIGNRGLGERIVHLAPDQAVIAATAIVLLAPSLPLLFMGQEWAASSPFHFFCHFEPDLAKMVRASRCDQSTDPAAVQTYAASALDWTEREKGRHRQWLELHRRLLRIRCDEIAPRIEHISSTDVAYESFGERGLRVRWRTADGTLALDVNLDTAGCGGFDEAPPGRVLFASPSATFAAGVAPPWSVRWTLR